MSARSAAAVAVAALVGAAIAAGVERTAPVPSAEVMRGGETAFGEGLQRREMVPGRGPQRWTTPEARFLFRDLPAGPAAALAIAVQAALAEALLLWPQGLLHSPYRTSLSILTGAGALGGLLFARWRERRVPGAGPWAFAAGLLAFLVQVMAATSPAMVVSDEVFHANNLARVAGGEWFITSLTQHARPFRFPYGVSFYALLVPPLRAGIDAAALVRAGAAASGLAASLGLFALLAPAGAARAGLAVILLQLLPGAF